MKKIFRIIKKVSKNLNKHSNNKAIKKQIISKLEKIELSYNNIIYTAYIDPKTNNLIIPSNLNKLLNSLEGNILNIGEHKFKLTRDNLNKIQSFKKIN